MVEVGVLNVRQRQPITFYDFIGYRRRFLSPYRLASLPPLMARSVVNKCEEGSVGGLTASACSNRLRRTTWI